MPGGPRSGNVGEGVLVRQRGLCKREAFVDPSVVLVEELARRAETRGSDVRLDALECMSPLAWPRRPVSAARWTWKTVASWRWTRPSHITDLEVRGCLGALQWRLRQLQHLRTRFAHLMDSQVGIGVVTKGRSSSHVLNVVVKRICVLVLASLCRPIYGYSETDRNPADAPSRRTTDDEYHA